MKATVLKPFIHDGKHKAIGVEILLSPEEFKHLEHYGAVKASPEKMLIETKEQKVTRKRK